MTADTALTHPAGKTHAPALAFWLLLGLSLSAVRWWLPQAAPGLWLHPPLSAATFVGLTLVASLVLAPVIGAGVTAVSRRARGER